MLELLRNIYKKVINLLKKLFNKKTKLQWFADGLVKAPDNNREWLRKELKKLINRQDLERKNYDQADALALSTKIGLENDFQAN